jgi:MFS transporter, putative metabolite transport protein
LVEIKLSQRLTLLLDASPLNGIQRWLWVLLTGGTLLDGFAIFVLGVAMPLIIAEFRFQSDVVGVIGASLVLGAVFGAGFGGPMADHLGRKPLMLADMIIIFAGAAALILPRLPWLLSSFRLNCGRLLAASPLVLPKSQRLSVSLFCQS